MELSPQTLLKNRYRIEQKLGRGGMGAVYLAIDTSLDTQVAVKSNHSPAPDSTAQFLREARLLASLRHANLPRVTDYFILESMQYLVMDYIPGRDLDTLIREEGPQPLERVLTWANQLGDAISFLHHQSSPIIHRDIKPANVRLNDEGEVVLVDFGIAKVVDASHSLTAGSSGYTPGYAPPEQYGGNIKTGPYTDQYSLAALIYHLLTGQKPADAIQRALGKEQLLPLSQFVPHTPQYLESAVERALSIRPTDRYSDIDIFLQAINSPKAPVVEQTPAGATPASDSATVLDWGTTEQATIQAGDLPTKQKTSRPTPEVVLPPPIEMPAPRRKTNFLIIGGIGLVFVCLAVAAVAAFVILPPLLKQPGVLPVASNPSETPRPAEASPTISASNTLPPTQTPLPPTAEATATSQPSPTSNPPTDTPVPTSSALTIGGGGPIVFASNRGDGKTFQLWSMQVSLNDQGEVISGDLNQLTDSPGDKRQPTWSPDGKKIAYVAPGENGNNIWTMNADGSGDPVQVTNLKGNESEPAWSPDGKWIAFTSDSRSDKVLMLYLVHPDGSGMIKLSYDQYESGPTWAPNNQLGFVMNIAGSQVLYIRGTRDAKTGATPTQPYYVTPEFFDRLALHGNLGQVAEPAWSPDGTWVAYTRQRSSGSRVFIAHFPVRNPIEKDILPLTDTNTDTSPAWSPDGQWIVFTSKRDGNPEIYIMRSTGKSQFNLSNDAAQDVDPAWRIIYK